MAQALGLPAEETQQVIPVPVKCSSSEGISWALVCTSPCADSVATPFISFSYNTDIRNDVCVFLCLTDFPTKLCGQSMFVLSTNASPEPTTECTQCVTETLVEMNK